MPPLFLAWARERDHPCFECSRISGARDPRLREDDTEEPISIGSSVLIYVEDRISWRSEGDRTGLIRQEVSDVI
jgi:hypothetical protein